MRRLHFFKDHATHKIQEQERKPEETEDEKPELTSHRQISGDTTEYSVSLDDDNPIWILKVNNKTGSVHAYMSERSIDFDSLDQLDQQWPELVVSHDGSVWASFRAMLSDDGHDVPPDPRNAESPTTVNEQEYERYDEKCGQDCIEYRFTIGPNSFIFRINPETNMCSLQTDYPERTFHLDDIWERIPEIGLILKGSLLGGLKRRLTGDGIKMPEPPEHEVENTISNKEED